MMRKPDWGMDASIRITNSPIFLTKAKIFCHGILHGEQGKDLATNSTNFRVNSWNSWRKNFRVLHVPFSVAFPMPLVAALPLQAIRGGFLNRDPGEELKC